MPRLLRLFWLGLVLFAGLTDVPIPFTYPAPMSFAYELLYAKTARPHHDFIIACILAYLIAAVLLTRTLVKRTTATATATAIGFASTLLLLSYPAVLQLFPANMEVVVWVLVALGVWAFAKIDTGRLQPASAWRRP